MNLLAKNNKAFYGSWVLQATSKLKQSGSTSPRLDALLLLEDVTGDKRASIIAHPDKEISPQQLDVLNTKLKLRQDNMPMAYIRGFCEFYGYTFNVTNDVLIPRPESEDFINILNTLNLQANQKLLDIGTGSGVLAITAKLCNPQLSVTGSDISKKALRLARLNAKRHNVSVNFKIGHLITSPSLRYDYIFANLPYVPRSMPISDSAKHEPSLAIYSDDNGLALIKELSVGIMQSLHTNGYLLVECLALQHATVKKIFQDKGLRYIDKRGLVLIFQKP